MPKTNVKTILIDSICDSGLVELENQDEVNHDLIFDEVIDEVSLILEHRYVSPRQKTLKSTEWWTKILPYCDDRTFKHELRISRYDFLKVLELIQRNPIFTRKQLDVEYQLAISLCRFGEYGSSSSWLKTASKFGVGEGTVNAVTRRVISALIALKSDYIQWPDRNERLHICAQMSGKLPKCVGYIEGTHMKLEEAPIDDHESYFSRKQQYAIQMQAIVDNNRKIRDVYIGYPASVHDARVLANSKFGQHPHRYLTDDQWIAGDSAYTLSEFLMTPYRKSAPRISEAGRKKFQAHFAKYRVKVENAFGILKEVFGSLKELRIRVNKRNGHRDACEWILACCVLYNIVQPELCDYEKEHDDDEEPDDVPSASANDKRQKLLRWIMTNT